MLNGWARKCTYIFMYRLKDPFQTMDKKKFEQVKWVTLLRETHNGSHTCSNKDRHYITNRQTSSTTLHCFRTLYIESQIQQKKTVFYRTQKNIETIQHVTYTSTQFCLGKILWAPHEDVYKNHTSLTADQTDCKTVTTTIKQ